MSLFVGVVVMMVFLFALFSVIGYLIGDDQ